MATINLRMFEAEKAERIAEIDARYKDAIENNTRDIKGYTEQLEQFADANPELFKDRKSLEWTDGTIGYRLGQHTLTKARTVSWDEVLEAVSDVLGDTFIRIKSELDKRAIIDQRDIIPQADLDACHIAVTQEENFFAEPKTIDETQFNP